ncbi:hypothetical protein RFI_40035, partial [Reticulomyxa filosa]
MDKYWSRWYNSRNIAVFTFFLVFFALVLEFEIALKIFNFGQVNYAVKMTPVSMTTNNKHEKEQDKSLSDVSSKSSNQVKRRNLEGCIPSIGFPTKPLQVNDLPYVCWNMVHFNELLGECMVNKSIKDPEKCEPCMPPKNMDTLPTWLAVMTQTVVDNERKYRDQRRRELSELIRSNKIVPSPHGILLMVLNWGYKHLFLNWLCGLNA